MSPGSRRPYRRRWPRRALTRDLLIVTWLGLCAVLMQRFDLSETLTAWLFFGGAAAFLVAREFGFQRLRSAKPLWLSARWRFPAAVAAVAVAAFSAVLAWPAQQASSSLALAAAPDRSTFSCAVVSVHDGDSLRCADGTRIRLHAVAAREIDGACSPGHPCPSATATAAREALIRLAADRTIRCQPTGRSYNRVTAICRNPSGVEINCAMVRSGTTMVWRRFNDETPICAGAANEGSGL